MKTSRRLAGLLLAIVMLFTFAVGVSADDTTGTITIDNAVVGQTYTIYEILYLESYNEAAKAYSYKATDAWSDFINSTDIKGKYVSVDDQGYVTWVKDADAAAFAKLAQAYAVAHTDTAKNQGKKTAESTTVEFTGLNLGYYLVDTTLGTLCSLDTTNPDVTIEEKNAVPENVKTVEEDSTGALGSTNDADIGQRVKFVSTITLPKGSQNVVFHDKMSDDLTLVEGIAGKDGVTVYQKNDLTDALDALPDGNYVLTAKGNQDGCTFEIAFKQDYLDWQTEDITLYVVYYATVNENAVVGVEGNPNTSKLSYGDSSNTKYTPDSKTTTYTWKIDVTKFTKVKGEDGTETEKYLDGAVFTLSKNEDGTNPIKLVDKGGNVYRVATADDETTITEITTDATGKFTIEGLDSDTYYLTEITAPAGYNKLAAPVTVVIAKDGTITMNGESVSEVKVENKSGTELPSTGGIGTTIFYILGTVLVLGTAVVLVTKVRMKKDQ